MSKKKEQKTLEVKISILKMIYAPVQKNLLKINSLIRGHYMEGFLFSDLDLLNLMELKISSQVLSDYVKNLLDQASEGEVEVLHLLPEEVKLLTNLSTSLTSSYLIKLGNTNLWEH